VSLTIPLPDTNSYSLDKPALTLDVNQIPINPLETIAPELYGLLNFEWNYFDTQSVYLCVTPETEEEIIHGGSIDSLGSKAYQRYLKSKLYKLRPPEASLQLADEEADELWLDICEVLWPAIPNSGLTYNQVSDVDQLFWHIVSSGSAVSNSAFLTLDGNFLEKKNPIEERYGVTVLDPNTAWDIYQPEYGLVTPDSNQLMTLWVSQQDYYFRMLKESE